MRTSDISKTYGFFDLKNLKVSSFLLSVDLRVIFSSFPISSSSFTSRSEFWLVTEDPNGIVITEDPDGIDINDDPVTLLDSKMFLIFPWTFPSASAGEFD